MLSWPVAAGRTATSRVGDGPHRPRRGRRGVRSPPRRDLRRTTAVGGKDGGDRRGQGARLAARRGPAVTRDEPGIGRGVCCLGRSGIPFPEVTEYPPRSRRDISGSGGTARPAILRSEGEESGPSGRSLLCGPAGVEGRREAVHYGPAETGPGPKEKRVPAGSKSRPGVTTPRDRGLVLVAD
jgi:hypothetical protein